MVAKSPSRTTFFSMGNHCLLVFAGESSFQGFLGGAGFRPSTVWPRSLDSFFSKWSKGSHQAFLVGCLFVSPENTPFWWILSICQVGLIRQHLDLGFIDTRKIPVIDGRGDMEHICQQSYREMWAPKSGT